MTYRAAVLVLLSAVGCGDDDGGNPADAGRDGGGGDAGPPMRVEDLPITEERMLAGLEGPVDVVVDDRGMPHIYATTDRDASLVQGYLMARDRWGQMELIRRSVTGRIAEFAGSSDASTIESDMAARIEGHKRNAEAIWAAMPDSDPSKALVQAFADGINIHYDEIRADEVPIPRGGEILNLVRFSPHFDDWSPVDTIAIGRYLSHALSYSAGDDISRSNGIVAVRREFPATSPDPRLSKRAGIFADFWPIAPTEPVYTRDGFPNLMTDTGTRALRPPPRPRAAPSRWLPDAAALARAEPFFDRVRDRVEWLALPDRGSNNWVVHGSKTASGAPLLANDPHLSLGSPPLFWYVHLDTTRAGGTTQAAGLALAGAPGVILGYNSRLAWGVTTTGYDVTDVYQETITEGAAGAPDTVAFEGGQVPIEIVRDTIRLDVGDPVEFEYEWVPHHGPIVPQIAGGNVVPRTATTALSVRWTGDEPSNEVGVFLGLMRASTVAEAQAAIEGFEVGSQNFVVITSEGDIFWSTQARIPIRDPRAMTWDVETMTGQSPCHVMPGTGEHEWTGQIEDRYIPHDLDPERGFIATANQDNVGVTGDGDALNDPYFLGCEFDQGHRQARITELLTELTNRDGGAGGVTPEDMMAVQGDDQSALGRRLRDAIVASLDAVEEARTMPLAHPDLTLAMMGVPAAELDRLRTARDRLAAWTFRATDGLEDDTSAEAVADSIATSIFNAGITRLVVLAFDDESERLGRRPWSGHMVRALQWGLIEPARLATYDATIMDTVLWDDLDTVEVETRDERVFRAFIQGLEFLDTQLGSDMAQWQWGKLHTLTFESMVPPLAGDESPISIPDPRDPMYPNGFPRHGDMFGIDAANFNLWNTDDFSYGSGPQQRLVVEMTADGPNVWNALPGGQVLDPDDDHHADEAERWRRNEAAPIWYRELDVVQHAEARLHFTP